MMPNQDILGKVTPQVQALLWIDVTPLSESTLGFDTINYLTDGLLKQHLKSDENKIWNQVTFVHQLFGKNCWFSFVNTQDSESSGFIRELLKLIPRESREQLLLVHGEVVPKTMIDLLKKEFTNITHLSL